MAARSPNRGSTEENAPCCTTCGGVKSLKRCGICKSTFYCSREHQLQDWPSHKSACKQRVKDEHHANTLNSTNGAPLSSNHSDTNRRVQTQVLNSMEDKCTKSDMLSLTSNRRSFDGRPFKKSSFLRVKNDVNDHDLGRLATDGLIQNGYCVLDNVFSHSQINAALIDIHSLEASNRMTSGKLDGGRAGDTKCEMVVNGDIRSDQIAWLEGTEEDVPGIRKIMDKMDKIFIQFNNFLVGKNISGRSKAMIACYPGNGTYYHQHVDNPSKDGRLVTCILYLNEGWDVENDGGLLRIFPVGTDSYVDVSPEANRLLFFWSDKRNPHEVQPAFRKRYAITVWYMDKKEREEAKLDKASPDLLHIRGEYALLEVAQRRIEVDEMNTKLEENATNAVEGLSEEELKALATMIRDVPDPYAALTGLGISPNIQDKLLSRLEKLIV